MEYMSFGKPIVAFNLNETRASAGDTAVLIEPGDVGGFASAVHELILHPEQRIKIGRTARQRIVNHLNWQNSASTLKRIYKTLE